MLFLSALAAIVVSALGIIGCLVAFVLVVAVFARELIAVHGPMMVGLYAAGGILGCALLGGLGVLFIDE